MAQNISKREKIVRVMNAVVAGTTEQTSSVIDMAGFQSCEFVLLLGDVLLNSVLTLKAQDGTKSDGSDMVDTDATIGHTASATDADDKLMRLDVASPQKRYLRAKVGRTTANAVIDGVLGRLYDASIEPITDDASVVKSGTFAAP